MKVLCILPARGGSKGIPNKNLKKINGKPLLEYSIKAALESKMVNKAIVCSENLKILNVAKKFGIEVIKRPKKLATDKSSLEPTIEFVLKYLKNNEKYEPDIIVLLQNTSPLRNSKHIDKAIQLMKKMKYDSIVTGFTIHSLFWKKSKNGITPLNYDPQNRPQRQVNEGEILQENGAMFITTLKAFRKSNCRISGKIGFFKMPLELSYNIDTAQDLEDLRKFLKKYKTNY